MTQPHGAAIAPTDHLTVGILGVGAMGAPMAVRLLHARGRVLFHSRSSKPALVAAGATTVRSARELGRRSDAVLVMLPDLPQLEEALTGDDGLLAEAGDLLVMIGSTSSAEAVRALAARLSAESDGRVRVVDCPVSGGVDGAQAGRLSIMLGGAPGDAALAGALLAPCGTPVHLGPLGAGEVAKACNQLVVASTILALGEATVLADRSGIDVAAMWRLLSGGYAGSNLLDSRFDKLVSGDDTPSGAAKYMVKDLGFAADVARATRTTPALLPTLHAVFDEIMARGLGDRDIAVTRRLTAERPVAGPVR